MFKYCLLFAFCLTAYDSTIAEDRYTTNKCLGCGVRAAVVAPVPVAYVAPVAPVVYRPVVTYLPYQYKGTTITRKQYHTPIRSMLFGKYRVNNIYAPMGQ